MEIETVPNMKRAFKRRSGMQKFRFFLHDEFPSQAASNAEMFLFDDIIMIGIYIYFFQISLKIVYTGPVDNKLSLRIWEFEVLVTASV